MIASAKINAPNFPIDYPDHTRVWIYQCSRQLTEAEAKHVAELSASFTTQWTAHSQKLRANSALYYHRFLCLFTDESQAGASGCSIDSSVRFVQSLEARLDTSFTDRMLMAYVDGSEVKTVSIQQLATSVKAGEINVETLVFNNLVANLGDMKRTWMLPLKDSWHMRFL